MAKDAHTIEVVWEEIEQKDQNGEITGYTVFYNESDDSKESSKNTTANETSIIIKGLKPYTTYCIKVAGYTKVGRSPLDAACYFVTTLQKGTCLFWNITSQRKLRLCSAIISHYNLNPLNGLSFPKERSYFPDLFWLKPCDFWRLSFPYFPRLTKSRVRSAVQNRL